MSTKVIGDQIKVKLKEMDVDQKYQRLKKETKQAELREQEELDRLLEELHKQE